MIKNKRGITLISLIITIIVLLFLASVAINLSLGNNGIFNKVKYAKQEYINSELKEDEDISKLESYLYDSREVTTKQYEDLLKRVSVLEKALSSQERESSVGDEILIDFTIPSTSTTWTKIANYPDGYTYSNSIIIGTCFYLKVDNIDCKYMINQRCDTSWYNNFRLQSDGIYSVAGSEIYGTSGQILLKKVK